MKLTAQMGRGDKVHLYIDGEYKMTTTVSFWNTCTYHSGDEIDEEAFLKLCSRIEYKKALAKCAEYIGRREYSEKQIRLKLKAAGFDDDAIDCAIQKCVDTGMIDDRRFAKAYISHLFHFKGMSERQIRYQLAEAGVDRGIAAKEMALAGVDDIESLTRLIDKKYAGRVDFTNRKEMEKMTGALQRRGFSYSDIKAVLKDMESEAESYE